MQVTFNEEDYEQNHTATLAHVVRGMEYMQTVDDEELQREGQRFYETLLRFVPCCWMPYAKQWLEYYKRRGLFRHRTDVNIRRYQKGTKYVCLMEINNLVFVGKYASKREMSQDTGSATTH